MKIFKIYTLLKYCHILIYFFTLEHFLIWTFFKLNFLEQKPKNKIRKNEEKTENPAKRGTKTTQNQIGKPE
jgi:hypothetical protein